MNINFNNINKTKEKKHNMRFILVTFVLMVSSVELFAEPYISFKTHQPCSACHVNPSGGGMRTTYGNVYGYSQLPSDPSDAAKFDFGKINDYLKFGGDLRYDFEASSNDTDSEDQRSFNVQSAQIYTEIKAGREDVSIYLDQQVSPGSALSREALIIKRFDDGDYLKIGKMMPQFGLRIEDDSAFIRQVTGFNFDNSDNGIEYGLLSGKVLYNFFATNGANSVSNNDNKFQFGARAEIHLDEIRLGGAFVFNDGDLSDRKIASLFAGYHVGDFTFLAEIDSIVEEESGLNGQKLTELVGFIELNYEIGQGHNLKITEEYYDPDDDLDEDNEVKHSILYEYTPMSNIQLRFGYRLREAPPQEEARNNNQLFVQTHFYF